MRATFTAVIAAVAVVTAAAQRPSFDVASIKRNTTVDSGGGGGMAPVGASASPTSTCRR